MNGVFRQVVRVLALALCIFHLYTGVFGTLIASPQRGIHVGLATALAFLLTPAGKQSGLRTRGAPWWDWLAALLILAAAIYPTFFWSRYLPVMIGAPNTIEIACAVVTVLLVMEAARRTVGRIFTALAALSLAYSLWGQYIPGYWGHAPIGWRWLALNVYFSNEGLWGSLTGLSATYLALFIIFGALLLVSGGGKTFIDIALLIAGRFRGGPAKVAVIASSLFGTLSGSCVANASTVGSFTIPLMKKLGYQSEFAAAVEGCASTGGMLAPPIMASAAFVMAQFLGVPYLQVAIAAIIPTVLYYTAVFMGIHLQAIRQGMEPMPRSEIPRTRDVLTWPNMYPLLLPLIVLLYLLIAGHDLTTVGGGACAAVILTYIFKNFSLQGMKQRLWNLISVLENAGKAVVGIVPLMASASLFTGLLLFTGLATKLSDAVAGWGGSLYVGLLMTGILVMLLGAALPLVPSYIIGVIVALPSLTQWGLPPMASHMFILYYAILSALTPPVAGAVFVAAGIANADVNKATWAAMKLAPLLYIMPFLWCMSPTLLMIGPWSMIVLDTLTAVAGTVVMTFGIAGIFFCKCNVFERLLLVVSGGLLLIPVWQIVLIGTVVAIIIGLKKFGSFKVSKQTLEVPHIK